MTAPTLRAQSADMNNAESEELGRQFKTSKDYTSYVVARMQQAGPESPSQGPPADLVEETEEEAVRPRKEKRVKGRRRAANPHAHIEAALRRQQDLKSGFRSLARPLKLVLDEMARRTLNNLEADSRAHQNAVEHAHVKQGLQKTYDKRTARILQGRDLQRLQLKQRLDAEDATLRSQYQRSVDDARDRIMDAMDYEMLRVDRQSRQNSTLAGPDTDDEDDVVLVPHRMSYRYERGHAIDPAYDSRSRLGLEVDEAHHRFDQRSSMRDMLQDQPMQAEDGFTIMDSTPREAAAARRQGIEGVDMLLRATKNVEAEARKHRRKQAAVLPNNDATSLMELANLASRPWNNRHMLPPSTPRRRPSTATSRPEEEDLLMSNRSSMYGTRNAGRKRSGSVLVSDAAPFSNKRIHYEHMPPTFGPYTSEEPHIKNEEHAAYPAAFASVGEVQPPLLNQAVTDAFTPDNEAQYRPDILAPVSTTRAASSQPRPLNTTNGERGGLSYREFAEQRNNNEAEPQAIPIAGLTPQQLASPFTFSSARGGPMLGASMPAAAAAPGVESESNFFRTMSFNDHRPMLQHPPPLPPTAQPVNHFANQINNTQRHSFSHINMPFSAGIPHPSWSATAPSPLVALPHGETPRLRSPMPFFGSGPPFPPFSHAAAQAHVQNNAQPFPHYLAQSQQQPPLLLQPPPPPPPPPPPSASATQSLSQYGGPMLAPAAGPFHTPQPAFAQQMGRQEQNRRRNTEGSFPRFRAYHGPS